MMRRYCPETDPIPPCKPIPTLQIQNETDCSSGTPTTKQIIIEIDPLKVHAGLTCQDFDLSVLLATGATDLLQPYQPIKPTALDLANTADQFESHFSSIPAESFVADNPQ